MSRMGEIVLLEGADNTTALSSPYLIASRMLVLGGELDGAVLPPAIHQTARAYEAQCHILEGMGHNLMLEASWETVARFIVDWLNPEKAPSMAST